MGFDWLRMELPKSIQIDAILNTTGGAFRAVLPEENEKYRYFFIVSKDPANNNEILMVTATTQKETQLKKFPAEVLVNLDKKDYPSLREDSIINCERARVKNKQLLRKSLENADNQGEYEFLTPLSEPIIKKICTAIAKCKTLPPIDKALAI